MKQFKPGVLSQKRGVRIIFIVAGIVALLMIPVLMLIPFIPTTPLCILIAVYSFSRSNAKAHAFTIHEWAAARLAWKRKVFPMRLRLYGVAYTTVSTAASLLGLLWTGWYTADRGVIYGLLAVATCIVLLLYPDQQKTRT